jgi:hypothetical protein
MPDSLQIMVLPTTVDGAPPQVLFDDGGIWRDTTQVLFDPQTKTMQKIQQTIARAMDHVGRQPNPGAVDANAPGFRAPFADLYKELLPPEVREVLKKAKHAVAGATPQLNVYFRTGAEWVPWELLHDGDGFLGVRFAIARLPIVPQATEIRPPRERIVNKVYSLLGKDVLDGPVMQNWEATFDGFTNKQEWISRFPSNGGADYPMVTQLDEARGADILHVTCHGGLKEQESDYFWSLDDKNPQFFDYRITPDNARNAQLSGRPLVFGNACASASPQSTDLKALLGFGPSFMIGGALNFVGTFAPITKTMAVVFAKQFYLNLFGTAAQPGLPIGEALQVTKTNLANATDPSYLFYCLYGPADSTYKLV